VSSQTSRAAGTGAGGSGIESFALTVEQVTLTGAKGGPCGFDIGYWQFFTTFRERDGALAGSGHAKVVESRTASLSVWYQAYGFVPDCIRGGESPLNNATAVVDAAAHSGATGFR